MAEDIATRLADMTVMSWDGDEITHPLCEEAVNEINRLRSIIKQAAHLLTSYGDGGVIMPDEQAVIDMVQKEARRG